jgi:hypothetical protein
MSDELVTLSDKQEAKRKKAVEEKRARVEERRKKYVPMSALIVANIIFLSLDIRALEAVYILTSSYLLASLTVLISGGLAMYWFDVLYPHSRRHNNETQKGISLICTILAIGLSGVLAFADYGVGTGENFSNGWSNILWAAIIILTITQGVCIAWWWSIDNHIAAEAKIEEAHAEAADQADDMAILRTKLNGLRGILTELQSLNTDFSPAAVQNIAQIMGIPLPTNSTPNKGGGQPQRQFANGDQTPVSLSNSANSELQNERSGEKGNNPSPKQNQGN